MLLHGKLRFQYFVDHKSEAHSFTIDEIKKTFVKLYHEQFISKCTAEESMTVADKIMAEEEDAMEKKGVALTTTERTKLKKQLSEKRSLEAAQAAAGMVKVLLREVVGKYLIWVNY